MSDTAPEKRAEIVALNAQIESEMMSFQAATIDPLLSQIETLQSEIATIEEACGHSTLEPYDDNGTTKYRCANASCHKDFGALSR